MQLKSDFYRTITNCCKMETIQGVQKGRQFQQFQYSNNFGGSDLQTAASGHGGYGHHGGYEVCCENGVDFGTLLALIGGKPESYANAKLIHIFQRSLI